MNWFTKLMGRDEFDTPSFVDDSMALPDPAPSRFDQKSGLPSFRSHAGRITRRFGRPGEVDARALIRDAFTPSQPVNDRAMFAGRRALLEDVIVAVEDQRLHFVLYGDRGIGKTSILHVFNDIAVDADYLVIYISCGERMGFTDFARRVAQRIPLLFHADYAPGSPEIEQGLTLADILPADVDVSTFGEHLGRISDTRVLMMLDEFDRVETNDFRRSIAELIKNLSDKAAPAQLVIAGVAANLGELIAEIPSIRRNILGVMVPNMSDDEVNEMLAIAEQRTGLKFTPEARSLVTLASLGLPYLVGLVAQHAALLSTQRPEPTVTKADVREAIRKSRQELQGRLGERTMYAISEAAKNGDLIELGKLAHAALRNGGLLQAELLPASLVSGDGSGSPIRTLLEPLDKDPMGRWRFADDGASIYIWLSALSAE